MEDSLPTLERVVAQFVTGFNADHIDPNAREAVERLIKDQFAVQLGASRLPWSRRARLFRDARPGKARIVGETGRVSAIDAAYMNATYGHGFGYDDFYGNAHPCSCLVPTAFAI